MISSRNIAKSHIEKIMDSNSFCLLLCFLLRPTGSINGNLIFPRRPVASAGTKGSPALVSLFSFFCHCVHLVPLRYPQGFGIGFGHQEPSAAEEMRLRRFICFLWCFNEQVGQWMVVSVSFFGSGCRSFSRQISSSFSRFVKRRDGLILF